MADTLQSNPSYDSSNYFIILIFIDGSHMMIALSMVGLKESIQIILFHNLMGEIYETTN